MILIVHFFVIFLSDDTETVYGCIGLSLFYWVNCFSLLFYQLIKITVNIYRINKLFKSIVFNLFAKMRLSSTSTSVSHFEIYIYFILRLFKSYLNIYKSDHWLYLFVFDILSFCLIQFIHVSKFYFNVLSNCFYTKPERVLLSISYSIFCMEIIWD